MSISRRNFLKNSLKFCAGVGLCILTKSFWDNFENTERIDNFLLKEAKYYRKGSNNTVQCLLCARNCVIKDKKRGFCQARINSKGKLFSMVYGSVIITHSKDRPFRSLIYFANDIEGLCIGTAGCNMRCKFCLASGISQVKPEDIKINNRFPFTMNKKQNKTQILPDQLISMAKKNNVKLIHFNLNEPTIYYEYMLDVAKIAVKNGIFTMLWSNAYINRDPLLELAPYLGGASIGLKAFNNDIYKKFCSGELSPVLDTLKLLKKQKIPFEIIYPVIPTVNDDTQQIKDMCFWIKDKLGTEVPLHFYRFLPRYKLVNYPPTPISTLESIQSLAKNTGLKYVYVFYMGDYPIPGMEEKIYCPNCKKLVLLRKNLNNLVINNTKNSCCKFCGEKLLFFIFK
ncbi:MAG: AmmeMemoRadiSam system radical SAM enzyme [Candidatus Omnitrophota bacterium]